MLLNRDQILKAEDLPFRDIEVPEWGGTVRIRTMTGGERDAFEKLIYVKAKDGEVEFDNENYRAKLLSFSIVDENGTRMFSVDDVKVLGAKSAKVINRLADIARVLSGISKEEAENIKNE
jgi:hypothetical protein